MAVTAAWTDPTTLDRVVGETYPLASYENLLGDVLYIYDVLTDVLALAMKFGSTLEVVGATTLDGSLHVVGVTTADGGDYGAGGAPAGHPAGMSATTGAFSGALNANRVGANSARLSTANAGLVLTRGRGSVIINWTGDAKRIRRHN